MGKTKILYVIKQAEFGGGETHLKFLIDNLNESCEPVVVSLTEGFLSEYLKKIGIKFYKLNSGLMNFFINNWKLIKIIKEEKIDLIHSHGTKGSGLILIPSLLSRKKFIYTVHAWSFHPKLNSFVYFLRRTIEKIICFFASKIVLVSKTDFQTGNFIKDEKKVFIPNVIDNKKYFPARDLAFRTSIGYTDNDFVVGFIGRFTEQKNPFFALEVINKLKKLNHNSTKNFKLLMVGDGELKDSILKKIEEENLQEVVKVLPFTPEPEKIFNSIDCIIIPSFWEGQPYVLLESMSCGVPAIVSSIPNFKEIIINEENGFCESIENIDDFIQRILQLANDESFFNKIKNGSIATAKVYQNQESVIKQITSLYNEILSYDRN